MNAEELDKVIEMWSDHILNGPLEGFSIEIDPDVKNEFAAIALYMDSKTVRASGEAEDFYEGYKQAATDILMFIGIEISEDQESQIVRISRSTHNFKKQQELMDHIWG